MSQAPLLVFGVGNPSRGDDALGPLFIERMERALEQEVRAGDVELLTDFQLQIEHALDLAGRQRVVFVDASLEAEAPFQFAPVTGASGPSFTTHAMSPAQVLAAYRGIGGALPDAWVLAIRGERFELGEPMSTAASDNLEAALRFFLEEARRPQRSGQRFDLRGTLQGVGFRPWVYRTATGLGLNGRVWNTPRGVAIEAFGSEAARGALRQALENSPFQVEALEVSSPAGAPEPGFTIGPSEAEGLRTLGIPPDLATCPACLQDTATLTDRHHGYAFTSCTACGPRFAIALALPFDRATTTMAGFPRCPRCEADYQRPASRRFHAETTACPSCGPRLWLANARGEDLATSDPVEAAAERLRQGEILGVQGLGAFHLVADATRAETVATLRRRKRRDQQPFALMVRDLAAAEALAALDPQLREALTGPARPIVLAPTRPGAALPGVNGPSGRTGLLLPYTPLLHRLTAAVDRPLVFTSANRSGGPAVIAHPEALEELGAIVDAFLFHDRPIARRVEDSVVAASPKGISVLRRSRGLAPAAIRLPAPAPEIVLALGGHQKNTACLVVGDRAYLSPHLGDLSTAEGEAAWARDVEGLEALLGVRAEVLAHDLHPDYASTRYALNRTARRRIGVQHHAAHVWAAIAELRLEEPVVGVVFDGTGFGLDGTAWGAEILLVDGDRWTRVSSYRPVPLPGGEAAIREVWRVGLAALAEAFGPEEALTLAPRFGAFQGRSEQALVTVLRMIDRGVSTSRARGMGRWFDALGALALCIPRAGFDGHVAVALEEASIAADLEPYPVQLPSALSLEQPFDLGPAQEIDLRPTVRAAALELLAGVHPGTVAARFHQTIVAATGSVVAEVLAKTGSRRVVLAGGCFQNRLLERGLRARLGDDRIARAQAVPLSDGGLSLGQAWAATMALRSDPRRDVPCV
ncbi:MAG: carbamoyltransferase HypF [Myxococcota bacterium]